MKKRTGCLFLLISLPYIFIKTLYDNANGKYK